MEISRRGARVPSRHPVGEQRASKVKFLKPFSSGPPPRSSSTSRVSADGSGGHRWKHRVPAARSFSRGVLASLSGKERVPLPRVSPRTWPSGAPGLRGRSSPRSVLPTWTNLLAREGVPCVLGGTVRISKVKASRQRTHRQVSPAPSRPRAPAPTNWPRSGSWVRVILLWGLCPFLSFPTIY